VARLLEAVDGQRRLAGALGVFAGHGQELAPRPWVRSASQRAAAPWPRLAFGLQQRVVGHLVQQVVVELALGRAFEVAGVASPHEGRALQRRQGLRRLRVQRLQGVVPEDVADDAGLARGLAVGGRQRVQPRLQQAHQRGGQAQGVQRSLVHRPVRPVTSMTPSSMSRRTSSSM
jgi:hypothetical protein